MERMEKMDETLAHRLVALTSDFYASVHESFSASRSSPWRGWGRCAGLVARHLLPSERLRLLDVACGNLRFERFLEGQIAPTALSAQAVDVCDELVPRRAGVCYRHLDVLDSLLGRLPLVELLAPEDGVPYDLSVCFGFFHHVTSFECRVQLLDALVESVRSGGLAIVSLWHPLDDPRIADRAREVTTRGCSELGIELTSPGDCLLGWQGRTDVYRYCHSFSDEEVDDLVERTGAHAELVARFRADGHTGSLNTYLVLRRLG
jgi:tRNA (uracil-5-)-methyltransferase TRM9